MSRFSELPLAATKRLHGSQDVVYQFRHLKVLEVEAHLTRLDLRDVEDGVDEHLQMLS
jgi:hypothetical protein